MMFRYVARDPLGNLLRGTLDVESQELAKQALYRDGLEVQELNSMGSAPILFAPRVSKTQIIDLTTQLAVMTDTGITLAAALEGILEQEENATLQKVLRQLRADVQAGEDFSASLAKHPTQFDATYVALVRASEETGSLPEMLRRLAIDMRKDQVSRSRVRSALAYPSIMLCVAIGVTIFLLTFILPKFAPIFEKKGVELPATTQLMLWLSATFTQHWIAWIAIGITSVVAVVMSLRTEAGARTVDYARIHMPVIGNLYRKVIISRCLRTLGAMISSGVMMLDALQRTSEVAGNRYYNEAWLGVAAEVTNGNRVCESLEGNSLFPKTLVQMIGAGEEAGKLDTVLEKVGDHYESEVEVSLKTVTSLLEPIMIIVMGVVVGGIGMSLLLPIFKLSRAM